MVEVYLDNHSLSKPHPIAIEKMKELYDNGWFRGQLHGESVFRRLRELFGVAAQDRFFFYLSAKEAAERFLFSYYLDEVKKSGRNHFLTLESEDEAIYKQLEQLGCARKTVPVNAQGQVTREILENFLKPRTGLLSLPWADPLTGVIHPIEDIARLCREKKVAFHVDASAVFGKLYFRFEDLDIDCLTFDGKLFHAPEGAAGLFLKNTLPMPSLDPQEGPFPFLAGLTLAADEAAHYFDHICTETARLRDRLEKGVVGVCSEAKVIFGEAERLPNCTVIAFPGISSEPLLFLLERHGIYATRGGGALPKLIDVLVNAGVNPFTAEGAISFSLSRETTEKEIDHVIEQLGILSKKLRNHSRALI